MALYRADSLLAYNKRTGYPQPRLASVSPTWSCQKAPRLWAGRVGLEQARAPSPQPIAQCFRPHHPHSPGPGALAYHGGLGSTSEQSPINSGHQGWVGGDQSPLGGGGGPGNPCHPVPSQECPGGEKEVASGPRQSAQPRPWSSGDNWEQPLPPAVGEEHPRPSGPLPLFLGRWGRSVCAAQEPAQLGKDKKPISGPAAHCAPSQLSVLLWPCCSDEILRVSADVLHQRSLQLQLSQWWGWLPGPHQFQLGDCVQEQWQWWGAPLWPQHGWLWEPEPL